MNGIYDSGKTPNAFTTMQIIDTNGAVVGSGVVDPSGRYAAKITVPLSYGVHKLRALAVDIQGHYSFESQGWFRLNVIPFRVQGESAASATMTAIASSPATATSTITTSNLTVRQVRPLPPRLGGPLSLAEEGIGSSRR